VPLSVVLSWAWSLPAGNTRKCENGKMAAKPGCYSG
jgi:N-acetyl-gamma-glutamylphosphate reductase